MAHTQEATFAGRKGSSYATVTTSFALCETGGNGVLAEAIAPAPCFSNHRVLPTAATRSGRSGRHPAKPTVAGTELHVANMLQLVVLGSESWPEVELGAGTSPPLQVALLQAATAHTTSVSLGATDSC